MKSQEEIFRRSLDVIVAGTVLLLALPLIGVTILLIRLESPGSAIFRQRRMGKDGKVFTFYKLRSMVSGAPRHLPHVQTYSGYATSEEFFFHQDDDPRVTRIGRFIRKFSIDELPNLVNVIRGEMAIVGPRPEVPDLAHFYGDSLETILSVPPGITSPAKANGRDALSFRETLTCDIEYVEDRTLWLDIKTMAKTVPVVISGKNVC